MVNVCWKFRSNTFYMTCTTIEHRDKSYEEVPLSDFLWIHYSDSVTYVSVRSSKFKGIILRISEAVHSIGFSCQTQYSKKCITTFEPLRIFFFSYKTSVHASFSLWMDSILYSFQIYHIKFHKLLDNYFFFQKFI